MVGWWDGGEIDNQRYRLHPSLCLWFCEAVVGSESESAANETTDTVFRLLKVRRGFSF